MGVVRGAMASYASSDAAALVSTRSRAPCSPHRRIEVRNFGRRPTFSPRRVASDCDGRTASSISSSFPFSSLLCSSPLPPNKPPLPTSLRGLRHDCTYLFRFVLRFWRFHAHLVQCRGHRPELRRAPLLIFLGVGFRQPHCGPIWTPRSDRLLAVVLANLPRQPRTSVRYLSIRESKIFNLLLNPASNSQDPAHLDIVPFTHLHLCFLRLHFCSIEREVVAVHHNTRPSWSGRVSLALICLLSTCSEPTLVRDRPPTFTLSSHAV